ncbi:MAG: BLUF domain-containing protein [Parafilimonas sp.]|nr:BLUF domain-containing protein [Parafilimonas sp.]
MIYYLVYLSSASHLYSNQELADILSASRLNNSRKNITGILLYHDGNVIQVLEGDREEVTALYSIIKEDSRHKQVIKMVDGMSDERNFPDWSMGFKAIDKEEWNEYAGYVQLNSSALISLIKKKNTKIDAVVKSFVTSNMKL